LNKAAKHFTNESYSPFAFCFALIELRSGPGVRRRIGFGHALVVLALLGVGTVAVLAAFLADAAAFV
jgi:hypothetical protein